MGDEDARFLRPDVIIEPLADRFYSSLHTVAPIQAAMNLTLLQLPMLESYLHSPQVHKCYRQSTAARRIFRRH